jgi:peptidoglycan/LPS O-acetylase OafA/YrhL
VWSHAFDLGGFGSDPLIRSGSLVSSGYLAVAGFFVLSGFLITRSFEGVGQSTRFLWHRAVRIFPGFLVCLVVTAFVLAPLGFLHEHATLKGYFKTSPPAMGYIFNNALLSINQKTIGTIIDRLPRGRDINGSLWTLQWEFACYLSVIVVGSTGLFRRSRYLVLGVLTVAYVADATKLSAVPRPEFALFLYVVIELGVFFWIGSCAYLFREFVPINGWIALICALVAAVGLRAPNYAFLLPPCLAYVVLYAAMHVPVRSFDRRVDLSYGLYIYAFPVQQILAVYGLNALGFLPYLGVAGGTAGILAAASWFAIERPCLAVKNATLLRQW